MHFGVLLQPAHGLKQRHLEGFQPSTIAFV